MRQEVWLQLAAGARRLVFPWTRSLARAAPGTAKDLDKNGTAELYAVDPNTGDVNMFSRSGTGAYDFAGTAAGGFLGTRQIVSGGDHDGDGNQDLLVLADDGHLRLVRGSGNGRFIQTIDLGAGFANAVFIVSGTDYSGDSIPDLQVAIDDGRLIRYNGDGIGGFAFSQPVTIAPVGAGWNNVTHLTGGADYNGDGYADMYAIQADVNYLEPGTSAHTVGQYVAQGAGWGTLKTLVGGGDFNGDGSPDLIGADSSGALYRYRNVGGGNVTWDGQIGSGWTYYVRSDGRLAVG